MKKILITIVLTCSLTSINAKDVANTPKVNVTPQKAAEKNENCRFLHMPKEVQAIIGSYLEMKNILKVESICKDLRKGMRYLAKTYKKQNIQDEKERENALFLAAKFNLPTKNALDIMKECKIKDPENITFEDTKKLIDYVAENNDVTNLLFDIAGCYAPESEIYKKLVSMTPYSLLLPVITAGIKNIAHQADYLLFHLFSLRLFRKNNRNNKLFKTLFVTHIFFKNDFFGEKIQYLIIHAFRRCLDFYITSLKEEKLISKLLEISTREKCTPFIHYLLSEHENKITKKSLTDLIDNTGLIDNADILPMATLKLILNKAKQHKNISYGCGLWNTIDKNKPRKTKLLAEKISIKELEYLLKNVRKSLKTFTPMRVKSNISIWINRSVEDRKKLTRFKKYIEALLDKKFKHCEDLWFAMENNPNPKSQEITELAQKTTKEVLEFLLQEIEREENNQESFGTIRIGKNTSTFVSKDEETCKKLKNNKRCLQILLELKNDK